MQCVVLALVIVACSSAVKDVYEQAKEETRLANLATRALVFEGAEEIPFTPFSMFALQGPSINGFTAPLLATQEQSFAWTVYTGDHAQTVTHVVIHLLEADHSLLIPAMVNADGQSITLTGKINANEDVLNTRFRGLIALANQEGACGWPMPFGVEPVSENISSAMAITRLLGNSWETELVTYSSTGTFLANSGRDLLDPAAPSWPVLRVWDTNTHQPVLTLEPDALVSSMAFSPDETTLAVGQFDGALQLFSTSDGTPGNILLSNETHTQSEKSNGTAAVQSLIYSANGTRLFAGSWDHHVTAWDLETGTQAWSHDVADRVNALALSPDNTLLAIGTGRLTHEGTLIVRSADEWGAYEPLPEIAFPREVTSVTFSHDGQWLAAGAGMGWTGVWSVETGQALALGATDSENGLFAHPQADDTISGLTFAPSNNAYLVSTTRNGRILLWSMEEVGLSSWQTVDRFINDMTYSIQLERLAFTTSDGAILEIHVNDLASSPTVLPGRQSDE